MFDILQIIYCEMNCYVIGNQWNWYQDAMMVRKKNKENLKEENLMV